KKENGRFADQMAKFRYRVIVRQQYKWKTANKQNVYNYDANLGEFRTLPVQVDLVDFEGAKILDTDSITVNKDGAREFYTKGGQVVHVVVDELGERPIPPNLKSLEPPDFSAPPKEEILRKLGGGMITGSVESM